MLSSYLTVAVRVLLRHRLYVFISVSGLACGIACCLLLALLVAHEWSFDQFHEHRDRLVRLIADETRPGGSVSRSAVFPPGIPGALTESVPGVEATTGYVRSFARLEQAGQSTRARVGLVSPAFLRMFSFTVVAGDSATALRHTGALVLTESLARRLFGDVDPDRILQRRVAASDRGLEFLITAVIADPPGTSSLDFEALASLDLQAGFGKSNRGSAIMSVYALLGDGVDAGDVERALASFRPAPLRAYQEELRDWQALAADEGALRLGLQRLSQVHWAGDVLSFYEEEGNLTGVWLLTTIAVVVLLIACTNFSSLAIALQSRRAPEIGVRKAMGAGRFQVVQQFGAEVLVLGLLGLALGLALADLFLPTFNDLVERQLTLSLAGLAPAAAVAISIVAVACLLAAAYIALVLARSASIPAMLAGPAPEPGGGHLPSVLVVLQYAVAIALLICTTVVTDQLGFMGAVDLGYDPQRIAVVRTGSRQVADRYRQVLQNEPGVVGVTLSDRAFTTGSSSTMIDLRNGDRMSARLLGVDTDYLHVLGIELIAGRGFSPDRAADRWSVIVNEAMARRLTAMGIEDPIGHSLMGFDWHGLRAPTIVGVVADFHFDDLGQPIRPLVMQMHRYTNYPCALIRLQHAGAAALRRLEEAWDRVAPSGDPVRLTLLADALAAQYRGQRQWQRLLSYATTLAVTISLMGLFGLAAQLSSRRRREIAIRKAMGAGVCRMVSMLSGRFVTILTAANLGAWPIAYVLMRLWLDSFAYRVDLDPLLFVGSGCAVGLLALMTASAHTTIAATRNPVEALRRDT